MARKVKLADSKTIGNRLEELRGDLPVRYVASSIGVSRQMIKFYETGKRRPSIDIIVKIMDFYNKSFEDIFTC